MTRPPWLDQSVQGKLMVCGTTSNAGKTTLVAGLCRLLSRHGVRVAPFKAQNMALNSAVTVNGDEIGRAQYLQAYAAGLDADVTMNPVLLKPTGERSSQVVVMGKPIGVMSAVEYHNHKPELFDVVIEALETLSSDHDVILLEGAGSPAELNLLHHDIVNLRVANRAECNAVVVGDIDPGGVFASLYGTVKVLPDELAQIIKGFVINKLRGDPALLLDGTDQLEALCGVPTFGVVPMLAGLELDAEDSLNLVSSTGLNRSLDVAVIHLPRLSNFTDVDPLRAEPDVSVRFISSASELQSPDLIIIPGTKSTVEDFEWIRKSGLAECVEHAAQRGTPILGICGGYQMLGSTIDDTVETKTGRVEGLGLLDCSTVFSADKVLAQTTGIAFDAPITGFQIHHGRVCSTDDSSGWIDLGSGRLEGTRKDNVFGTTIHGLFEADEFRRRFLTYIAEQAQKPFTAGTVPFSSRRDSQLDRLADHLEEHLDMAKIVDLII